MKDTMAGVRGPFRRLWVAMLLLSIGMSLAVALAKDPPNYTIVITAASDVLAGRNPYSPPPGLDFYKYSPLFAILIAPFIQLPAPVGIFFFVLLQSLAFSWGFFRWSRAAGYDLAASGALRLVAIAAVGLDLATTLQNCQVNAGVFALMLLAGAQYAEGNLARSGLSLSLATNVKLFPFTLSLCLLTGFRRRFWLSYFGGLALWLLLPASILGFPRNEEIHRAWFQRIASDREGDPSMLNVGSFIEIHFGKYGWQNEAALAVGAGLGILTLLLFRRRDEGRLNRFLVPLNGLYVLLFSYLSESPTSILAVAGIFLIGASAVTGEGKTWLRWCAFALALLLVPFFYSDLAPAGAQAWGRAVHLKTIGYLYIFLANLLLLRNYGQARS